MEGERAPRRLMAGRILLFALPTGVVVFLGASSPAIAQRTPRFFFPVLAAVDGRVAVVEDSRDLCGLKVVIVHEPYGYLTIYCHSSALTVQPGEMVKRGQRIGALGTTGQRAWPGFEHVHLELWRRPGHLEDPASWIVGCFDGERSYPADRLVLTYPVKC